MASSLKLALLAGAAVLASGVAHAAVSVVNGSFETGPNPSGFTTLLGGNTSITGWTVTGGSIDYIGSYWQASNGSRSIDMNGNALGGISQTLTGLTAGGKYLVSFDIAGNTDSGPTIKTLTASAGATTYTASFDTSGHSHASMGWTPHSFMFTATGSTALLAFTSTTTATCCWGPALDNVAVSAVPEPATWAMMLIGFAGLAGVARSRRAALARA